MSDIKQKTKIGVLWNFIEKISVQVISFVLGIILARILSPSDYGVVGLLTAFIILSNVFVESGFTKALIQKQNRNEADFSTVFYFNLIMSIALYLILFQCAPLISKFYKNEDLIVLSRVLFLVLILNSLTIVQNTKLMISVNFRKIAIINMISTLSSGLLGVFVAYRGFGPWAIVVKSLSYSFISFLLFTILGKWYPKNLFDIKAFKNLFGFGSKLLLGRLLSELMNSINNLVLGKVYAPKNLGYYSRAQQFPELCSGTVNSVVSGVTFPLLSSLQNDINQLCVMLKQLVQITALFVFPVMFGLSAISRDLVLCLLGEKWEAIIPFLVLLSFSYMFQPINCLNLNVIQVLGKAGSYLILLFVNLIIRLIFLFFTIRYSIMGVVIGQVISSIIYYLMLLIMIERFCGVGFFFQIFSVAKYFLSSIGMFLAVKVLDVALINVTSQVRLIVSILFGVVIYPLILFLFRDEVFHKIIKEIDLVKKK